MKRDTGQNRTITDKWRLQTQLVRGGTWRSEIGETSEAMFMTSGYAYDCAEDAAARFDGDQEGYTYSRLRNPTCAMFENKMALIEGAEAARSTATGMAAMTSAML
jgi:O-succinylhomoserine sulfhydrylase